MKGQCLSAWGPPPTSRYILRDDADDFIPLRHILEELQKDAIIWSDSFFSFS